MDTQRKFEDLKVWQAARALSKDIYGISNLEKFKADFALKDQIRRASGSIMDNIAEGYERDGNRELIQFLSISKGSSGEVRSQLYRAFDLNYIEEETFNKLKNDCVSIGRMLNGFMKYLKQSELKGTKYHKSSSQGQS